MKFWIEESCRGSLFPPQGSGLELKKVNPAQGPLLLLGRYVSLERSGAALRDTENLGGLFPLCPTLTIHQESSPVLGF